MKSYPLLPSSMGKVAIRSLAQNGIYTLGDAVKLTEKELLSIHGVGPKAMKHLKSALIHINLSLNQ